MTVSKLREFGARETNAMPIRKVAIVKAIQEGTSVANYTYESWSNGSWITDAGVEGLLVTYIAEAVSKRQDKCESLNLEVSFREIKKSSRAKVARGRKPKAVGEGNKADIVLFNRPYRPTCVIEVKRLWNTDQCLKDLERIRDLIHTCSHRKAGSLRRGFLAMMIAKQATKRKSADLRIKEQSCKIMKIIDNNFERRGQNITPYLGAAEGIRDEFKELYGDWKSASFCIELASKNRR